MGIPVLALGHILWYGPEVTAGVVSGFYHEENSIIRSIMTDAKTFSGFDGGPLVNVETGNVLGINRFCVICLHAESKTNNVVSIDERNVFVPIDNIKEILPQMVEGKRITHGTIGLHLLGLTKDILQGTLTSGAEIIGIDARSPARRRRKLCLKDVIVAIDGERVDTALDAGRLIDQATVGEKLKISVMRKQRDKVDVTVVPNALVVGGAREDSEDKSPIPLVNLWNHIRRYVRGLVWRP